METAPLRTPVPFWYRIPELFLLPLRPPAIFVTAGAGILVLLGLQGSAGLAFWLYLAGNLSVVYYGRALLMASATGEPVPPALGVPEDGWLLPVKLWVLISLPFLLLIPVLLVLGPTAMVLMLLLYPLVLPAATLVLAVDNSLRAALSPGVLLAVIRALGGSYLILLLFFALLNGAKIMLLTSLGSAWGAVELALAATIDFHFTLMICRLLGYAAYQNQARLGYETEDMADPEPELAQFREFLAEDRHAAAAEELALYLREHPRRTDLKLQRHRLLKLAGDGRLVGEAGALLRELLDGGGIADAIAAYDDARLMDPHVRPRDARSEVALARSLREAGRGCDAVRLLDGFHRRYPDHAVLPAAYALVARIFAEDLDRPRQAAQVLARLLERYAGHPEAAAWQRLLGAVEDRARTLAPGSAQA